MAYKKTSNSSLYDYDKTYHNQGATIRDDNNPTLNNSNELKSSIDIHLPVVQPSIIYKASCIDFFIKRYKCKLITSEFRYGSSQLVTDLVILTKRNTISIEIKSEYDDLRRVTNQVQESLKNFNLTIVFADSKHKDALLSLLPIDAGITIFHKGHCEVVRSPKRKNVIPHELVSSIPASFLRSFFRIKKNLDSDKMRGYVLDEYSTRILECFRAYLDHKFSDNYCRFLLDRGQYTHIEDIPTLTMKDLIEIK